MDILILTSINPVKSSVLYSYLSNEIKHDGTVNFLCFPYFADLRAQLKNLNYIASFFSMISLMNIKEEKEKIFDKDINIVIGNIFKPQKFDFIIALDERVDEEEPFDSHIELLKNSEEYKELLKKVDIDKLYKEDDAEIKLPTLEHIKLFLKGVIENDFNRKTKTGGSS